MRIMPLRNSHTHCQVAPADPQAKIWQRVWLPNPTTKPTDKQTDEKEHRSDNSVYVAIAGEVVNRRPVLLIRYYTYTPKRYNHPHPNTANTFVFRLLIQKKRYICFEALS